MNADFPQKYTRTGRLIRQLWTGDNLIGETVTSDRGISYCLLEKIGEGGMGRVYKAVGQGGKDVAVKITTVEQGVKRFQLETAVLKLLGKHPNITELYDWGLEKSDIKFCVMEYITGMPLDVVMKKRVKWFYERPLLNTIEVGIALLRALDHVHKRKVVHRDVKPHNIMADRMPDGTTVIKLMDFGISKTLEKGFLSFLHKSVVFDERTLTLPGQPIGTLGYAPREQIDNSPITESADIFSCGVTLIEIARGTHLFNGDSVASYLRELEAFYFQPVDFPGESAYITAKFNDILAKAVAIEAERRYRRADKMMKELLPLQKELKSRPRA